MAKNATGRPSSFTPKMANRICERMSSGESLRVICKDPAFPDKSTVMRWVRDRDAFRDQYARAREDLVDHWAEEILEEAENREGDVTPDGRGNNANVQRSKQIIDTKKWLMSKLAPKKYGEFNRSEISGPDGGPQISEVRRLIVHWEPPALQTQPEPPAQAVAAEPARQIAYHPPLPGDLPPEQWKRLLSILSAIELVCGDDEPPAEMLAAIEDTVRTFKPVPADTLSAVNIKESAVYQPATSNTEG